MSPLEQTAKLYHAQLVAAPFRETSPDWDNFNNTPKYDPAIGLPPEWPLQHTLADHGVTIGEIEPFSLEDALHLVFTRYTNGVCARYVRNESGSYSRLELYHLALVPYIHETVHWAQTSVLGHNEPGLAYGENLVEVYAYLGALALCDHWHLAQDVPPSRSLNNARFYYTQAVAASEPGTRGKALFLADFLPPLEYLDTCYRKEHLNE